MATEVVYPDLLGVNAGAFRCGAPGIDQLNEQDQSSAIDELQDFGQDKNGVRKAFFARYDMSTNPPPAGAIISAAAINLTSSLTTSSTTFDATVCVLAEDGKWEQTTNPTPVSATSPNGGFDIVFSQVQSTVFGILADSGVVAAGSTNKNIERKATRAAQDIGQTLEMTGSGTLGFYKMDLGWTGLGVGDNITIDVYAATANDGSDDTPTGSVLASSDVFALTPATSATAVRTFVFSGGDQISLTNNNRYVFMTNENKAVTGAAFLFARVNGGGDYADGSAIFEGSGSGFDEIGYPSSDNFPHYYEQNGTTLRDAPFGTALLGVTIPAMPIGLGVYDVEGLAPIIQEWVSDPGYTPGDPIGLHIAIPSTVGNSNEREIVLTDLTIEWRPAQTRRMIL